MARAEFNAPEVMREMKMMVTVHQFDRAMFRLRAMKWFMRLAIWIGGVGGVEFEFK